MENNEKNTPKRAPESMEDLISLLFFPSADESDAPPSKEAETSSIPDASESPMGEESDKSVEADSEHAREETDIAAAAEADENAAPESEQIPSDGDTAAVPPVIEATPVEEDVSEESVETELPSPEITEVDSAAALGVAEIEQIRKDKSKKKENDAEDLDDDNWDFLSTSPQKPRGSFFAFFLAIYIIFLSGLAAAFVWGVNQLVDVYDRSDPDRVVDGYIESLSGTQLFNDIAQRIKVTRSEFETELAATENALKSLSFDADKNYFLVSETDTGLLYDVFAGSTHLYSLTLGKSSEAEILSIRISFWEVKDVEFVDNCITSAARTYTVSAPIDADVRINGVKASDSYITNDDYHFFIGSIWETEIPDIARCVQYTVSGLYGPPTVTATLDGEQLEVYVDEDGTSYHAKYPSKWVKNYTVSVPSGAAVHVNGVLATKISSNGKGEDTIFDSGENAKTDVYVIEGLFEKPTVSASFGTVSLGEPTVDGESFVFGYIEEMYRTSHITVPKGAEVKVNGISLTADNSSCAPVQFSELMNYAVTLNNYMPAELHATTSVRMPEFVRYTVVELYVEPSIEVTLDGLTCKEFYEEHGEWGGSHMYDFPVGVTSDTISTFAQRFAKQYVKYCTEGCYGVNDDIELRKNLYQNWVTYLSYIVPNSLCYDKALESYTDIRYRPIRKVVSEEYNVQNIIKYSDDIYFCRIVCTVARTGDEQPVISFVNAIIVKINGEYRIWSHDTIPA